MSYSTVPPLCGTLLSQLLHIQLTGTIRGGRVQQQLVQGQTPPYEMKEGTSWPAYTILLTVPFVLSGYLCFRFQHTNHTKVNQRSICPSQNSKVISIVINSILWDHTNQLPPCHVIKLLRSFIVIIILWVIAMWKLTLAYLS